MRPSELQTSDSKALNPIDEDKKHEHNQGRKTSATTGVGASSIRALTSNLVFFYFRVPVKAFFRTRFDYLAYPRAINPALNAAATNARWSWHGTSVGVIAYAVKQHGWRFIPEQILPPLLANVTVGAVLYTSYLQTLGLLYEPIASGAKRVHPPPPVSATFQAGAAAGLAQSLFAAPLDALTIRFKTADLADKRYRTMWHYAYQKARNIGTRGVLAGWAISGFKDSIGYGLFFASFEYVKAQCFYDFVAKLYGGGYQTLSRGQQSTIDTQRFTQYRDLPVIKPHYMIEPTFLLLAGVTASIPQQLVQHPMTRIQHVHFGRIAGLDAQLSARSTRLEALQSYASAYRKTFRECLVHSRHAGGLFNWLFADFWRTTIRQAPSTSAALVVFEVLRRKYGLDTEDVKIHSAGFDVLLT